jgi:hypothetical protein
LQDVGTTSFDDCTSIAPAVVPPVDLSAALRALPREAWTTPVRPRSEALWNMLRAARLEKNVPLLFLVLAGALTQPSHLNVGLLCVSLALTLVSAAFMTHLNIITDVELDRDEKPHLWRWMSGDPGLMMAVLGLELGVVLGGMAILALVAPIVAAALAVFTLLTVLYSYNFLSPSNGVAWRLKAHWLGHFGVCVGGYLSLWIVGHASSASASLASLSRWLPVFFLVSLSEYALFLAESAIDAGAERRCGLETAACLLGRRGSSLVALGVWLSAAIGVSAYAAFRLEPGLRNLVVLAFGPALLARGLVVVLLALGLERDQVLRSKLPDAAFWGGRLLTVVTLAVLFIK